MYILIDPNNSIIDVREEELPVPDMLSWFQIPDTTQVQIGFMYKNSTVIDPAWPDVQTAQQKQTNNLSWACQQQIVSGFTSSILGSAYTYASGEVDQRNILAAAQATNGGLLSCQDATGVWDRRPHTKAQAQQALDDFVSARDGEREKLGSLVTQINAATTIEAVQAIVWA